MDLYPNFYAQPAPIHPHHHHMNPVHQTHIQGGYPSANGYGTPIATTATSRVPQQQQMGNSLSRRIDNRQNFQSDPNLLKTLWIGNIDSTIDENLIQESFNSFGINVHNIKIMRNKESGLPLGYGFVSFDDRYVAEDVLRELNGKKMPNFDDKRFFLKRANRNGRFSVFVGNLPPQIDNELLLNAFMAYYPSVSSAKVIMNDGISKGFGFVSFEDENDYFQALTQQSMMLGAQPISVSKAKYSNNNNNMNNNNNNNNNSNINNMGNRQNRLQQQHRDQSFMNVMSNNNNRNDLHFRQQQQQHY